MKTRTKIQAAILELSAARTARTKTAQKIQRINELTSAEEIARLHRKYFACTERVRAAISTLSDVRPKKAYRKPQIQSIDCSSLSSKGEENDDK